MTLARARQRLGGRTVSHGNAGAIVTIARGAETILGVILWSDETTCDVWMGDELIKRTSRTSVMPAVADAGSSVTSVAADARAFARLEEGQDVRFDAGSTGRLIERCRWGALVAKPDGKIFAVGFRRFDRTSN